MKDRIIEEAGGISVKKKKGMDYSLYYFKFHLSDEDYEQNSKLLCPVGYCDILDAKSIIELSEGDCVCLVEKDGDREVERYEYYYRKEGTEKKNLSCKIKRSCFWGNNAFLVTFHCQNNYGEAVGSRHFKVHCGERQFSFPEGTVKIQGKKKGKKERYVIVLPDKVEIDDVDIRADDVVKGKYTYDCKR